MTKSKIIVCGGNGAGKSTLGKALAQALGFVFMDVEDYYFPQNDADYKYDTVRTREQVNALLLDDMKKHQQFVLASVKGNFDENVRAMLNRAVYLHVPKDVRMQRVYDRSFRKFGDRMLHGGDLYEREQRFLDMVRQRPENEVLESLRSLNIPIIQLDGTLPIETNVQAAVKLLAE
jgi:adenylate kinase family enzyme